jgi:hypothetical protein
MKHVLIVENASDSLKKNESNNVSNRFILEGSFTEFDVENRNKRKYTAENFMPHVEALLKKKAKLGVVYGEYDHPDVFDLTCKNLSHAIETLTHNEQANRIDGSISLLSNHWGREARAIINDGYPLFVSSRAAGVTDAMGNVLLKELFTYDIVCDPGFATSRVTPKVINESFGLPIDEDVQYRIYEMSDAKVNELFGDNKNDMKTKSDLMNMEQLLKEEISKIKAEIMAQIAAGKFAPEDMKALSERFESVNEEILAVKGYLEFLQPKVAHLMSENKKLANENKSLKAEVNENIIYSNHLATGLKKLNKYAMSIDERLTVNEKMTEYVAEHAKANILFSEDIAENLETVSGMLEYVAENVKNNAAFLEYVANETATTQNFAEYVANETKITQKFAEHVANETKITQKFAEHVANETKVTQEFTEYVANEKYKDEVFLNYIAEKVDGVIGYSTKLVSTIKENTPVNENVNSSIHNLEMPEDFLGIKEEREISNKVTEGMFDPIVEPTETEPATEPTQEEPIEGSTEPTQEEPATEPTQEEPIEGSTEPTQEEPIATQEPDAATMEVTPTIEPVSLDNIEPEGENQTDDKLGQIKDLVDKLVSILGTDETGIVTGITDDEQLQVQKSGTDEIVTLGENQVSVINTDENISETVGNVLAEIKKQKVLANQQPHFFSFLTEAQISDFNALDRDTKDNIILTLNESEYYNASGVLNIIGRVINEKSMSYEDKLVANIPANLKDAWNALNKDQKLGVIAESKYFTLTTSNDIANFFSTCSFAKSVISPNAVMIKESLNNEDDKLNDNFIDAFLKSYGNLK